MIYVYSVHFHNKSIGTIDTSCWCWRYFSQRSQTDQSCWDVVDSSWLPFLQWLYCSLHFSAMDGVVILCVCLGTVQYWWIAIGFVIVQFRAVFCPSVQYLSLFCEAFSWTILDSRSFPLFHSGQVFHQLVCPLTIVLLQIFFNLITLFSYPAPQWGAAHKLKSHLLKTQTLKVLPLNPGVGQYIAMHATLTARDFFLANFYPSGQFTCIFPKLLPSFSCVTCG